MTIVSRVSRVMRAATLLAVVLLLPSPLHAQRSEPVMSVEARTYLTAALDTLQRASMHAGTVNWQLVRDSALLLAAGAERPRDTYSAIAWALQRVDKHSFLQASRGGVNQELLAGRFGYLRIPFYSGPSKAPLADSLQSALRQLETGGACGYIVDLRMNGGGNIWPMQTGIGPLLGDSVISLTLVDGRVESRTLYVGGQAIEEERGVRTVISSVDTPYVMRNANAPVAVLMDKGTGSSAEGIAIAFRPRPNTRFFGQPSAGYSTVNRGAQLPDGANLVITVGAMTDRTGRAYGEALVPDELVPTGTWPTSRDAVARRAVAWLATRPPCQP